MEVKVQSADSQPWCKRHAMAHCGAPWARRKWGGMIIAGACRLSSARPRKTPH
jgi:hypothetical protein